MSDKSNRKMIKRTALAYAECVLYNKSHKVSITQLCEAAEISRTTFYNHFKSIEEMTKLCNAYFADKICEQSIYWLTNGRTEYETVFKRRNLLFTNRELDALRVLLKNGVFFVQEDYSEVVRAYITFAESLGPALNEKDKGKMNVFARAYCVSVTEAMNDYSSERGRREYDYTVKLWNILFPENKI